MYYLDLSKLWSLWKLVEHLLSSLYASGLRVIIDQGTNAIKKAGICELPGVSTQELSCWNWHLFMFFWLAQLILGGLTTPSFFLFLQGFLACILTRHQSLTDVFRYIRSWYHLTDAAAWWMIPPKNSCKVYLSCCHPSTVSPLLNSYCCTKVTMWNCLLSTESIVMWLWFALLSYNDLSFLGILTFDWVELGQEILWEAIKSKCTQWFFTSPHQRLRCSWSGSLLWNQWCYFNFLFF